jgi:hypothetical protein
MSTKVLDMWSYSGEGNHKTFHKKLGIIIRVGYPSVRLIYIDGGYSVVVDKEALTYLGSLE